MLEPLVLFVIQLFALYRRTFLSFFFQNMMNTSNLCFGLKENFPQLRLSHSFCFAIWNYWVCEVSIACPAPLYFLLCTLGKLLRLSSISLIELCAISVLLFTGSYVDVNHADSFSASYNLPFAKPPHFLYHHVVPSSSSIVFLICSLVFFFLICSSLRISAFSQNHDFFNCMDKQPFSSKS